MGLTKKLKTYSKLWINDREVSIKFQKDFDVNVIYFILLPSTFLKVPIFGNPFISIK
jgi:hypothetical protein